MQQPASRSVKSGVNQNRKTPDGFRQPRLVASRLLCLSGLVVPAAFTGCFSSETEDCVRQCQSSECPGDMQCRDHFCVHP
ncbi:MAG TPA: hypothetical protein VFQ61_29210, partial [Polyangiaceae bacterium]|nr:hypothetical protein [Polyangiaceae bacterium]